MGSLDDRLRRLENRISPPAPPPSPHLDRLLAAMDRERQRLDAEDRAADEQARAYMNAMTRGVI